MSRLLLISRSRKFESRMRILLDDDLDTIMGRSLAHGASAAIARLTIDDPDVAILGPALSYAQAYELSNRLSMRYPHTGIMLVRENLPGIEKWVSDMKVQAIASPSLDDAALIEAVTGFRERLKAGVKPKARWPKPKTTTVGVPEQSPVGAPVVVPTVEPVPASEREMPGPKTGPEAEPDDGHEPRETADGIRTQIIAVVSPKGGVGKTTMATNIAVGLGKVAPMSVVLIDGDAQFGDVATALSLDSINTLPDAVSEAAAGDTIVLKTYLTVHPAGFYAICGAASPVDGDRVTGEQLGALIDQLSGKFRYVIIDTAPGLGEHTLAAIEQCTDAVLVCGMSVTSARGLRTHLTVLSSLGILPRVRHLVLNFADRDSGLSIRDIEAITGIPVDVAIPRSKRVVLSTNRGIPVLQDRSNDSVSKAMSALVRRFDLSTPQKRGRLHRRAVVA
jgi:pilus assembly protein CpaE